MTFIEQHSFAAVLLLGWRLTIAKALRSRRAWSQKSLSPDGQRRSKPTEQPDTKVA
jgi:hypothetical protein